MIILTILIFGIMFLPIILLIYDMSKDMCIKQPKKKKYNIQDEVHMVYEAMWVEEVIKSCKTYKQLKVTRKLCHALFDKYKNKVDYGLLLRIDDKLYWVRYEMEDKVTYG